MSSPLQAVLAPVYTRAQLNAFYAHVHLPQRHRHNSLKNLPAPEQKLAFLSTLVQHTLVYVPFENLALHYAEPPGVLLGPQQLFSKIVDAGREEVLLHRDGKVKAWRRRDNMRGGYCMENNMFLLTVLRTIGYDVYAAGARVHDPANGWMGWNHMVLLVTIAGQKYLVDVGFGGPGPTHPLPIVEGSVQPNVGPAGTRLQFRPLALRSESNQKVWVYQFCRDLDNVVEPELLDHIDPADTTSKRNAWRDTYSFTELEFFPADFEVLNAFTSHSRHSFFTFQVIVMRFLFDGEPEVTATVRDFRGTNVARTTSTDSLHAAMQSVGNENGNDTLNNAADGTTVKRIVRASGPHHQIADLDDPDWEENSHVNCDGIRDKDRKIVGSLMITTNLRRKINGKTEVLIPKFESEEERVRALEKWFGIWLTEGERRGIHGMASNLDVRRF